MPELPPQLDILDLRHFSAKQLRPLLHQEAALWNARLNWEYVASTELLLTYLDSRMLPGFVALHRGHILGYTFCVYEGHKAIIGDIYAAEEAPSRLAIAHTLTRHLLETLEAAPDIDRIESQLLLFDPGTLSPVFTNAGFITFPRLFLEADIEASLHTFPPGPPIPPTLELLPWQAAFYQPTAELIHASYSHHIDSQINDQYRSLHGSLRFLHNIVRFPGCGLFTPSASFVLRERRSGHLVATILISQVAPAVGHVTQLTLAPDFRGQGLGHTLLHHTMRTLLQQGFRTLSLTVTEDNPPARSLYARAGFRNRLAFEAVVRDKPRTTQPLVIPTATEDSSSGLLASVSSAFSRRKATPTRS